MVDRLTIGNSSRSDTVPSLGSTDPLAHRAAEISPLGRKRDVGAAATSLYEALVGLDRFAWDDEIQNAGAWLNEVDAPMNEALASYELARKRVVDAAKIDLGTA